MKWEEFGAYFLLGVLVAVVIFIIVYGWIMP
jgi:hypothetical protein